MGYKPIKDYDFKSAPTNITITKIDLVDRREFHEGKYDRRDCRGQNYGILINGQLLCHHMTFMDQSYITPTLFRFKKKRALECIDTFSRLNYPFPYQVCEFEYDGFGGTCNREITMPYTAKFREWSGDPGVVVMDCSDGKQRLIPTFAMPFSFLTMPNDMTRVEGSGHLQFFGAASKS